MEGGEGDWWTKSRTGGPQFSDANSADLGTVSLIMLNAANNTATHMGAVRPR
jgi:hypothetical protein